ncbi:unnamed protein product [Sympodiomycopsis kandeliae]
MAAPPSFHQDPGAALCRTGVKSARHRSLNLRALGNGAGHQRSSNMARKSLRLRPPPRPNWLRKSRRLRPDPLPSRLSKSRRPPPSRPPPRSCRSLPLARRPPTPTRSLPHCPLRPPPPAKYQVASKFSSSSSRLQATSVSKFQASSSQARPAVSAPLSPEDGPSKQMAVAGSGYASGQLDGAKKNRTRVAIQTGSDSYKRICSLAFAPKGGLNLEDALTHAKGRNQEILEEFFNAAEQVAREEVILIKATIVNPSHDETTVVPGEWGPPSASLPDADLVRNIGVDPRRVIVSVVGEFREQAGLPDISVSLAVIFKDGANPLPSPEPHFLGTATDAEAAKFESDVDRRLPVMVLPAAESDKVLVYLVGDPTLVHANTAKWIGNNIMALDIEGIDDSATNLALFYSSVAFKVISRRNLCGYAR